MSKQLTFSATASVLAMALFAMVAGLSHNGAVAQAAPYAAPAIISASH